MPGFDPKKPLSADVKLHLEKALDAAIKELRKRPDGRDEAIHKARKRLKRARALLRLCRDLAPKRFHSANRRLGIAAGSISKVRDAAALVECADWLAPYLADNGAKEIASRMRSSLQARLALHNRAPENLEKQINSAITLCRTTLSSIKKIDDKKEVDAAKILADGWARRHKKAVHALAACKTGADDESFHDLRKSTQQTVYQAGFLSRAWPNGLGAMDTEAKELAGILGHEHDLTLLIGLERSEPGTLCDAQSRNQLLDLLQKRRAELRTTAITIAEPLYSGDWKKEAKRVKKLWKAML
ncbi:CHAD domain-containing protein [Rhizobium sp. L1K21]|uniref:CHAD domain-containing protein n=1 Tax=Rhizobium sp. L1K21 TaxID=2954933 RepID=UPI0020931987|nr:CHAD domain-containing protein [Rhizobium sp. L1K21]MCO6184954.1 CHAD domain-containing protein [Rhizobium sp. L1K21]